MTEKWAPMPGYEGRYEISDRGRVRSVGRWCPHPFGGRRWVKPCIRSLGVGRGGYLIVVLHRDGHRRTRYVAQLVMEAFVGPRPPGMEVCHKNGRRTDNQLQNLRYDTPSGNQRDSVEQGTHVETRKTHCPRNHPLEHPNLSATSLRAGARRCLACQRAAVTVHRARKRGESIDFGVEADRRYAEIAAPM